ncbi:DUF3558 domain-containing protein [Amycolatopsis sulphurea]|uniref:DUF3558 domain-containing protein n=1 Tax=Amycolatopsis sulphurea TaxID=76022 RepID=UPI001FEB9731|nr:DUF3558 domain-containing protein [Amycolatopsis sulphurea]
MTKALARSAMIAAALLVATACSSTSGTPSPATSAPPVSTSTGPAVPQVSNPLNASKFEQDPCGLLTRAQAGQFIEGVRTSGKSSGRIPMCNWHGENGSGFGVSFIVGQGGLATVYKNGQNGGAGYFEPAPDVSGYPAAFTATMDDRKSGGCQIMVGITNDELVVVGAALWTSSPAYNAPCPVVTKAAELVVAKLKDGA